MGLRRTIGFSVALLVISGGAMAGTSAPTQPALLADDQPPSDKIVVAKTKSGAKTHSAKVSPKIKIARRPLPPRRSPSTQFHSASAGPADRLIGSARSIGTREMGSAAWYGGGHVGMRTASGTLLDRVHATAAHRSLPLNSLARVTNLKNGRSVIVVVNDRGPVSTSLIIDLSPGAAEQLDMMRDGVVPVAVEPVAIDPAVPH